MNYDYSVLMAVYVKDNPEWFALAIQSMIDQTYPANEILIVEDGPITEELSHVIASKAELVPNIIRVISLSENKGLGEALRIGVSECKYEWIVRMDSDDYSSPQRCEKQFQAIRRENADIVGCDVAEFEGSPQNVVAIRAFPEKHDDICKFGRRRTPFAHPAVIMRKSQVLQVGNYQKAYLHEDFDLFVRLLQSGCKSYTVKENLVSMRVNRGFYSRRGGLKYLKCLLSFNRKLYRSGWMNTSDFVVRSCGNIIACLIPSTFREWMYMTLLRKKAKVKKD